MSQPARPCLPKRYRLPALRLAAVQGLMLVVGIGGPLSAVLAQPPAPSDSQGDAAVVIQQSLAQAIARAERSVVAIARVRNGGDERPLVPGGLPPSPTDPNYVPQEFGTGVIVASSGQILTAYHVLGDPEQNEYFVWRRGTVYSVEKVLAADPWMDLAVLQLRDAGPLPPIEFGDAEALAKGHLVAALGNPHGIARDGEVSASLGIIANLRRRAPLLPLPASMSGGRETVHQYGTLLQTDARLSPGSSGGPLIDLQGRMVGLITMLAASIDSDAAAGFAIPVDQDFRRVVETLQRGESPEYGFLGVATSPLRVAERRQGLTGARMSLVVPGTPAAIAGLEPGDIVTHVGDTFVRNDSDFNALLGVLPVAAEVRLTVLRDERTRTVDVVLAKRAMETVRPAYSQETPQRWRGLEIDYATAVPRFEFRSRPLDPRGCVGVLDVVQDSPAWKAGLRPGDFISQVEGRRVTAPEAFYAAVEDADGRVTLRLAPGDGDPIRVVESQ